MPANPTLSMVWALEEYDHMHLSVDMIDLPEVEPTLILSTMVEPVDVPSINQPWKRKSHARLRRDKSCSVSNVEGQRFNNLVDVYRKRVLKQRLFQSVNMLTTSSTSLKPDPIPMWMANATCSVSLMSQHQRAVQITRINFSDVSHEAHTTSSSLAGAASLGLRRWRNRAPSEPPVPRIAQWNMSASKGKRFTNNTVKAKVRPDDESDVTKSQQKLIEGTVVPHPPRKPQPENYRKRPQIRGVPLMMVRTN